VGKTGVFYKQNIVYKKLLPPRNFWLLNHSYIVNCSGKWNSFCKSKKTETEKMEQVKTKVWKVKIKLPLYVPNKNRSEVPKTVDWSFTMMLN
jgi:hypothetical protein